ncbi:MAG: hypothetical protein ABI648_15570 [Betaproteobacteria bacterium]
MPNMLRNLLAIVAGIAIGGGVNMALITLSPSLIPPPTGVDVSNAESLTKGIHLFEPRHFVMPFLAQAVGRYSCEAREQWYTEEGGLAIRSSGLPQLSFGALWSSHCSASLQLDGNDLQSHFRGLSMREYMRRRRIGLSGR